MVCVYTKFRASRNEGTLKNKSEKDRQKNSPPKKTKKKRLSLSTQEKRYLLLTLKLFLLLMVRSNFVKGVDLMGV